MKRPLRFKVGKYEFLIPEIHVGGYEKIAEEVEKANKQNPPSWGTWQPGSLNNGHINLLASLDELGVMPKGFFDRPVVSGSFWFNWYKGFSDANYRLGFGRPEKNGRTNFIEVDPSTRHSLFLTNWEKNLKEKY